MLPVILLADPLINDSNNMKSFLVRGGVTNIQSMVCGRSVVFHVLREALQFVLPGDTSRVFNYRDLVTDWSAAWFSVADTYLCL